MRGALLPSLPSIAAVALAFAAVSCGESDTARMERETLAAAGPVIDAFVADAEAGRVDAALARTTRGFQGAAKPDAFRAVQTSITQALGAAKSRRASSVESLAPGGEPPQAREAVVVCEAVYERGAASIRARVQRDATRGGWLVDACEVRTPLFTYAYRPVGERR